MHRRWYLILIANRWLPVILKLGIIAALILRREIPLGKAGLLIAAGWIIGSLARRLIVALAALIIGLGPTIRGR